MLMKNHLFTTFIVAFLIQLLDFTSATTKPLQVQKCLGFLKGQERYCCNYIQARTPKKTTTITSTSTSTVPGSTVLTTDTSLTTNSITETNIITNTITSIVPTTILTTETDTVTNTITVTTYPSQQRRRRDSIELIGEEEELEKRGWLDLQLKVFTQGIIFDACSALLKATYYNCPALPPITSTVKASTVTTLPAVIETKSITNTVDVTSSSTVDITETITSIQSTTVTATTTSTAQATQTVTSACQRCHDDGKCGVCYSDCDTSGNLYCASLQETRLQTCTSNTDCPSGYYCSVGSSCYFQTSQESNPLICIRSENDGSCSAPSKRSNLLYDTDKKTGKIIRYKKSY